MPIPYFNDDGNLPPGIHEASWIEIQERFGRNESRQKLLEGLWRALFVLKNAGCQRAYLDGSFTSRKHTPHDFDLCWDRLGVDNELLDLVFSDMTQKRAAQKRKYGGEIFPADAPGGIDGRTYLDFFQICKRTRRPKGIILIDLIKLTPEDHQTRVQASEGRLRHDKKRI